MLPRLSQYLHYRVLFHDECVLAANILKRSLVSLLGPYGDSMAPGGFMSLTKAAMAVGGVNEYAVRFLPFVGGVAALWLFFPVAKRLTSPLAAVAGLALLAVGKEVIYFGAFVRPYSTDATITLILLGLACYVDSDQPSWRRCLVFGLVGAVAVWISYPATFLLVGIGGVLAAFAIWNRDGRRAACLMAAGIPWAVSFLVFYAVSIAPIRSDPATMKLMNDYYTGTFMPLPPRSFSDLQWFNWQFIRAFEYPGGFTLPGLAAFLATLGGVSCFLRRRKTFCLLLAPVVVALFVSGLHKYPFYGRTLLYVTPIMFMLIGEGVAYLMEMPGHARLAGGLALIMVIGIPANRAARIIIHPTQHHQLDRSLDHVAARWQPGDVLYLHDPACDALRFCLWRYSFKEGDWVVRYTAAQDVAERTAFLEQNLDMLRRRGRVWVAVTYDQPRDAEPYLAMLDTHAVRTGESASALGSSVYLYDFRQSPLAQPPKLERKGS